MVQQRVIRRGEAVVLTADRDYTYFTHADDELKVLDLASKIASRGFLSAIVRSIRLDRMEDLVGVEYNEPVPDPMFIDCPRVMTTRELAHDLASVDELEVKGVI